MLIRSFKVSNYKGFRDAQSVELAPLTLFYGENSSGKSALLRLLPWISESMADERAGPVLDGAVGREALFGDLAHVSTPHHPIEVMLTWTNGQQAKWVFRGGALPGSCELKSIELNKADQTWSLEDDGDGAWQGEIPGVKGLLPCCAQNVWSEKIGAAKQDFDFNVQWLQGVRAAIPRVEKVFASSPSRLPASGEGVARLLIQWERAPRSENESNALNFVLEFYRALGFGLNATDVAPSFFRLDVSPVGTASAAVNLIDTGEGLTQVLAPLVALARAAFDLGPNLVCLEQPELHLHTDAQRALAISIAHATKAGAQVIIETHSEVLLAAVQLAIAVGSAGLIPQDVALYWVERRADSISIARQVTLDEKGRVGSAWPIDAFNDLLQLKNELLKAQRRPN